MPAIEDLVRQLYASLAAGDRAAIQALISEDFVAEFSPGYGAPIGGSHSGADDAIEHGWWAIGRRFRALAEPEEWIPTVDGRLLVVGTYRGRARGDSEAAPFAAPFAHLWSAAGDRLTTLKQITDTVTWGAHIST